MRSRVYQWSTRHSMSVWILMALLALTTPGIPATAQSPSSPVAEAPTWVVGDTWVFRFPHGGPSTVVVTSVAPDSYTVRHERNGKTFTEHVSRTIEADPEFLVWDHYVWPLRINATWSRQYEDPKKVMWTLNYTVTSYEPVTVPAGTFDAFRIEIQQCAVKSPLICEGLTLWYAPAVKWRVKEAFDNSPNWVANTRGQSIELLKYTPGR